MFFVYVDAVKLISEAFRVSAPLKATAKYERSIGSDHHLYAEAERIFKDTDYVYLCHTIGATNLRCVFAASRL